MRWIREAKFPRISDADFTKLFGWHEDEMVDYLEGKRELGIAGLVAFVSRMRISADFLLFGKLGA